MNWKELLDSRAWNDLDEQLDSDMARICRALCASQDVTTQDQSSIAARVVEVGATLLRKNSDYGSSVFKPPSLVPSLPFELGILVRMSDKIARLQKLLSQNHTAEVDESIDDTMKDLAGYAILFLARERDKEGQL